MGVLVVNFSKWVHISWTNLKYHKWYVRKMFNGDTNVENLKEIITLEQVEELFKQHCHYGWHGLISYIPWKINQRKICGIAL